jgi:ectoine hydroxylase-related dioxygenase (phytanoyl-CoA dioxygenase family)
MKPMLAKSTEGSMYVELEKNGWTIGKLPSEVLKLLRNEVLSLINNSRNMQEVRDYVNSLPDEDFRKVFSKEMRFFSFATALFVQDWASSLKSILEANKLIISPVSKNEIRKNDNLRAGDKDFFFRCVRAFHNDVAPAHYDAMFWEILQGTDASPEISDSYEKRWKIWIPLFCCDQNNSLQVISGSHIENIPCKFTESNQASYITKSASVAKAPGIDEQWLHCNENRFKSPKDLEAGKFLLFHDKLVHRGPQNSDSEYYPRVSCEFTLLAS